MPIPTMPGITAQTHTTPRLTTRVLFSGPADGIPVLFIHGNASSATFWEETMLALPAGYRAIAPDQRGYGDADRAAKVDATRGLGDLADDAFALMDSLGIDRFHVVGHSLGGAVVWRMIMDQPARLLTVTLAAPGSPYGFGGTKDLEGTLSSPNGEGSGGGIVNAEFTQKMAADDRSADSPQSPRNIMLNYYFKPPFKPAREEELLASLNSEHIGPDGYPGDFEPSALWPFAKPGKLGPANALSPIYAGDVSRAWTVTPKPPILWVRGEHDQIVSDASLFDMATYGILGVIPGYPGQDVFPQQPMVGQTRAVLEKYAANGGTYRELVLDAGHTPYLEKPEEFNAAFHQHLKGG